MRFKWLVVHLKQVNCVGSPLTGAKTYNYGLAVIINIVLSNSNITSIGAPYAC